MEKTGFFHLAKTFQPWCTPVHKVHHK